VLKVGVIPDPACGGAWDGVTAQRLAGSDWPLTGRTAELSMIEAALSAGTDGGVVLAGGPGVGKTRLAREAVLRAAQTGRDTDWVVATRSVAVVPFGALWHLLADAPRSGASPLELLRRTAARLTARAAGNAMVLGVDDADLLDDWSAALIHQLVLHGHVFVVATVRVGTPAPDAVTALWKDGLARRLNVRPLASAAVDELLCHELGPQICERTRRQIRRVAGGYPLVLRELLAGALEEGALIGDGGVWRWADGPRYGLTLVELVQGRLDTLSESARTVVEVVAFGEPLAAAILTGLADGGMLTSDAVGEAESRGFLARDRSGRRELVSCGFPVHGEVIRSTLPDGRAGQIRQWLIEASQAMPVRRRDDVLRLGTWQLEAGPLRDRRMLIGAACQAAIRGQLALAERLMRAGSRSGHALAQVLIWQGRHEEAAAALPGAAPDGIDSEWTVTHAWSMYWGSCQYAEAIKELAGAGRGAAVIGARAWLLLYSGQCGHALAVAASVVDDADVGTGWPFSLAAAVHAHALVGQADTAIAIADRGLPLANRDGTAVWDEVMLSWAKFQALLLAGRTWEAEALAEDRYAAAASLGLDDNMIAIWAVQRARAAAARGRLTAARDALREAVTLLAERDYYQFSRYVLAELAGVAAQTGDAAAARDWMSRSDRRRTDANRMFEPSVELRRAWTMAVGGELASAARQARYAADLAHSAGQYAIEAEALYDVARFAHATAAVRRLSALADTLDGALAPVLADASAALAAMDGHRLDQAAAAFDDLGLPVHAAELAGAAARAHRTRGRAADAALSLQQAAAFGPDLADARTPLLKINWTERRQGLTRREREVALMAAAGLSSGTIAAKLQLSVRTVSNHLAHIYAKFGVASRAELAALLTTAKAGSEEPN
jgi:DNA-binding CsgD family transcriptional regulator